ncbi:MAG: ABC transporter ATP-binding protein [Acidimicrobiia bacterium]|nr:ABC transporter ATP-binding protein [Acidimicrobiia bacterium]MBT8215485.1 ABC transporter ATP-binding protein [Acidimicrobiia bacterium]NNF10013.1 ABC transporter ATP-binding protein [Acidimicrobiia bacterium]NNL71687.1 ABC transporter ATP-binding protein [Acidimicrobiia bacterium]
MLQLHNVSKRYGPTLALDSVDLRVAADEVVAVLGPSGSGKSTLLRMIAGLEHPDTGTITWQERNLADVPVHARGFGFMFQDYALFPHRTVGGNVAFGLRMSGWERAQVEERVAEVLELVGLSGAAGRSIDRLSGGEAQRVALARTLAPRPELLMLDEPLGSLDRPLRERLIVELGAIFEQLAVTVLYVTHDQEEAFTIADRVVVMNHGAVVQQATPEDLWQRPAGLFVSDFLGFTNQFEAPVTGGAADLGWATVPVDLPNGAAAVVIRPDALTVDASGPIPVTMTGSVFRGDHYLGRARLSTGDEITFPVDARPRPGDRLSLRLDPAGVLAHPLPPAGRSEGPGPESA